MKIQVKVLVLLIMIVFASCWNRWTPSNDDGDGYVFFLDRHRVFCNDGEALQVFHLYRPSGNRIAYEYACFANSAINGAKAYTEYTPWSGTDSRYATNYLDNHAVLCPDDHALVGFKLERNGGSIRYQFRCSPIKAKKCFQAWTNWTDGDMGRQYYLDRQVVGVAKGSLNLLRGFRLGVSYYDRGFLKWTGMNFRFSYWYCQIRDVDTEKNEYMKDKHSPANKPNKKPKRVLELELEDNDQQEEPSQEAEEELRTLQSE